MLMSALFVSAPSRAAPERLEPADVCEAVSGQMLETDESRGTHYSYQTKIYALAGVQVSKDGPELIRRKIQAWWKADAKRMVCSQLNFSVHNGGILKLAVERNSRDFLNDMVRKWQVDVNVVDSADGKTVLDYVEREIEEARKANHGLA